MLGLQFLLENNSCDEIVWFDWKTIPNYKYLSNSVVAVSLRIINVSALQVKYNKANMFNFLFFLCSGGERTVLDVIFRIHDVLCLFASAILIVYLLKLALHTEFLRIMKYRLTVLASNCSLFRWSSALVCSFNRNHDGYAHVAVWMNTMFYLPIFFFFAGGAI